MTDELVNPFDDDNFAKGGGLWDDKNVTIIGSKFDVDRLAYGDGSPVLDAKTGAQAIRNVWVVIGIAEDDERERKETYSIGGLIPTVDGEGFTKPDGTPGVLHKNSEAAKFAAGLKSGGFDMNLLFVNGKSKVSALIGAQLHFVGHARLDKGGTPKKNKAGYEQFRFFPDLFLGFKDGVGAPVSGPTDEDVENARGIVTEVLTGATDNTMTRAELVRAVSKKLAGDARGPAIVGLLLKPEFHVGAPWTLDGTTLKLVA